MKTIDEMIDVMQAYKDGKEIECLCLCDGLSFCDLEPKWENSENPCWDWIRFDYRIKPEPPKPEYVPYNCIGEFIRAQQEHGGKVIDEMGVPFTTFIEYQLHLCLVSGVGNFRILDLEELFTSYTWADGTPCGKLKI